MKKKYVLKNKRRFSAFVIAALIFISVMAFANSAYGFQNTKYRQISVNEGDTLWMIAKEYSNKSDIRKYIFEVKKINHMNNGQIYAGTTLRIPE